MRILANLGAEVLKEGTPLLEFVPVTDDYAVELLIDGNDVPLIVDSYHNDEGELVLGDPVRCNSKAGLRCNLSAGRARRLAPLVVASR